MSANKKIKLPFGFYVCALSYTFERAAYYAAKFLIFIFLTTAVVHGGLGISSGEAAIMQSFLVAFTYLAPILGGAVSDRWIGARYTIPFGLFLMAIGYYLGSLATDKTLIYLMIALVAIGTAFFKGNNAAIVGQLFTNDTTKADSVFSILYSFINIGTFIGTTAVGILYATTFAKNGVLGFVPCFQISGAICFIAAIWFICGWPSLGEIGKKPFKSGHEVAVKKDNNKNTPLTIAEKKRVIAILLVSGFSIIFWIFWYLSYLAVYEYANKFIRLGIGSFNVPLSWFDSLNGLCCIALGPIFGVLWIKLARRPQGDMSLFKKTAIGLLCLGGSFLILTLAELFRGVNASETIKASLLWIIAFGILLSLGEMFFSPLGNSFVSKYAPKTLLGMLMGVWSGATFFAGISYGYVYKIVLMFPMMYAYLTIAGIIIVASALLFIFEKQLASLVESKD